METMVPILLSDTFSVLIDVRDALTEAGLTCEIQRGMVLGACSESGRARALLVRRGFAVEDGDDAAAGACAVPLRAPVSSDDNEDP